MDPCPFVRVLVGNLGLKFPAAGNTGSSSTNNIYQCKIKLKNYPTHVSTVALVQETQEIEDQIHACFSFNKSELDRILERWSISRKPYCLKIAIYNTASRRGNGCGLKTGKLLGTVSVPLDLKGAESRACLIQNGWVGIGKGATKQSSPSAPQFHVKVKAEPDPRFVFQFDGEPECSPLVFQVNGNARQPVFTCKFTFRNSYGEGNLRSRSSLSEPCTSASCFTSSTWFNSEREQPVKERKGWSVIIHDLSGSPVAAASMVTPFVPSPGTDKVSKSNPGAWLILRPAYNTWKPWGRLEAWRQRGGSLGYRFDLIPDGSLDPITLANSTLSTKTGGNFTIDVTPGTTTPLTSPSSSFDLSSAFGSGSGSGSDVGSGSWAAQLLYRGFVMTSTVEGDGRCSMPAVEVGVQHVACTEDAAGFVALAAAMDLSMDACRSFSQKLRKELRLPDQE